MVVRFPKERSKDFSERTVVVLEYVAASALLLLIGLVLYTVFLYKPA